MSSVFLIISALLPFLTSTLQNYKAISPGLGSLINGIEGAVQALVTELTNPTTGTVSVTAASLLAGISSALSVLQTQTQLSPTDLIIVQAFVTATQAGLAASKVSSVDPTKLQPITAV